MGALVEYNYYTGDELHEYFEKGFKEMICPVLEHGKEEIVLLLKQDKCHANILREEETLDKLKD
ncbi:unknown [Clostridium sp. CAG:1013]|nr:unknown [Clostridium sp. CAG:1013]